jgi:A/G-specific adenine glycosylase
LATDLTLREIAYIRRRLIRWYNASKRDLPWRRDRDPYAIWVSEVMLQQTQVATVIPFYERFIERFPSIRALAQAHEQDVLRYWEGLGYYRRARQLHQAAQLLMNEHGGSFPPHEDSLQRLPGFGPYTVGAILSQAFDLRLPAVDTNVARVLCRIAAWNHPLERNGTKTWLWENAKKLLPRKGAGNFNQALMELGQIVCSPRNPTCLLCPVKKVCRGRMAGIAHSLPMRRNKPRIIVLSELAVIVRRKKRLLLCQRPSDAARWPNMWEFATATIDSLTALRRKAKTIASDLVGFRVKPAKRFGALRYGITRFRVTLIGMEARFLSGRGHQNSYQALKWVSPDKLDRFPFSVPQRRLARKWLEHQEVARQ